MAAEPAPQIGAEVTPTPETIPTTSYISVACGQISESLDYVSAELSDHVGVPQDSDLKKVITPEMRAAIAVAAKELEVINNFLKIHVGPVEESLEQPSANETQENNNLAEVIELRPRRGAKFRKAMLFLFSLDS